MLELSIGEICSLTYERLVDGADSKQRRKVDAMLDGKLGPHGGYIIDDPDLPEALQGKEAPPGWEPDFDPWKNPIRSKAEA